MYTVNKNKTKKIILLFSIMIMVSLFTILAYTLYLDSHTYEYNKQVIGTKLSMNTENLSENTETQNVIESATSSVVGISKLKNNGTSIFLENSISNLGLGTGVLVSENGYIVTNQHVSGDKYSNCYITLENGLNYSGTVVWADSDLDLAIIKINMKDLPYITLGDSDEVKVGENVYAIGNPIGYEFQRTVTSGIISGNKRTIKIQEEDKNSYMEDLIQTDATINQGNSGGPLINTKGEMIGITSVKVADVEGIGFAIPINIIKPIINSFVNTGTFEESYLGIFGYDKEVIPYLDYSIKFEKGIYVAEIDKMGPLKDSNIVEGDIIEKIDDIEITSMSELKNYIYTKKPGDKVILTIKRKTTEYTIEATLGNKT